MFNLISTCPLKDYLVPTTGCTTTTTYICYIILHTIWSVIFFFIILPQLQFYSIYNNYTKYNIFIILTKKENYIQNYTMSETHSGTTTDQKVKVVSSACNDSAFNKQYTSIPPTSFGDGVMASICTSSNEAHSWKKSCTYN